MAKYIGPLGTKTEEIDRPYSTYVDRMLEQQKRQERLEAARLVDKYRNDPEMTAALITDSLTQNRIKPQKENAVSTVDDQIKAELQKRRNEREVEKRLALVDAFGEDPFEPGTVITFEKEYAPTKGKPYTYAVIKAPKGDKWFTTGHDCVIGATFTWDQLIEHLVTGPYPVATVTVKSEGGDVYPSVSPATEVKDK